MHKVDYHVHSSWSPDSRVKIRKALEHCLSNHISEIVFTEHLDMNESDWLPSFDLASYQKDLISAREEYPGISIGIGLELGVYPGNLSITKDHIATFNWDFLIMSVHQTDQMAFCSPTLMQRYDKQTILENYWNTWFYNVENFSSFHVLGHLDYLLRYQAIEEDEFVAWNDQKDHMLKVLVDRGQGIEINAKGLKSLGRPHPPLFVLKRFKELGGEIITLGSDAHTLDNIGKHFELMAEYLQHAGYEYFARRDFANQSFCFDKLEMPQVLGRTI